MYYTIRLKAETAAARIAGIWELAVSPSIAATLSRMRRFVKGIEVESIRRYHRAVITRNEALIDVLEARMDALQDRIDRLDDVADVSESILFSLPPVKATSG
jgi:hypothetical protein